MAKGASMSSMDIQQQRDIGKAFFQIAEMKGEIKELKTALIGIDGKNGLRGELRSYMEQEDERMRKLESMIADSYAWQSKTEQEFRHYLDVERKETCYGAELLDEYIKEQEAIKKDSLERRRHADELIVELEKQKIATRGIMIAATITAIASLITAILK